MSGALAGKFNVPQIVCVSGTFPFKKSLTVITGIDSNSSTSPSPIHYLAGGGPLDNTFVGITRFKVTKKAVIKIRIRVFIILLEIVYQHLGY